MAGGAGGGFERGAHSISQSVMSGIQLGMQQKRYDQLDARYNKMFDFQADFERGKQGLPPLYAEEEQAAQHDNAVAATRPEVPSSVPTSTPGPLGIPKTSFPVGPPVQPMPAEAPKPTGGAMGLIPPAMRMSIGRNPSMGMSSRRMFGRP
jgi:hypothetical protein